jgi:hypothetical protein
MGWNVKHDQIARRGVTSKDDLKAKAIGALRRLQKLPTLFEGSPATPTCTTSRPEFSQLTYVRLGNSSISTTVPWWPAVAEPFWPGR